MTFRARERRPASVVHIAMIDDTDVRSEGRTANATWFMRMLHCTDSAWQTTFTISTHSDAPGSQSWNLAMRSASVIVERGHWTAWQLPMILRPRFARRARVTKAQR